MANSGEHCKVTHEFLLWSLEIGSRSITSIVRIARMQEVPMNPQFSVILLALPSLVIVIIAVVISVFLNSK